MNISQWVAVEGMVGGGFRIAATLHRSAWMDLTRETKSVILGDRQYDIINTVAMAHDGARPVQERATRYHMRVRDPQTERRCANIYGTDKWSEILNGLVYVGWTISSQGETSV